MISVQKRKSACSPCPTNKGELTQNSGSQLKSQSRKKTKLSTARSGGSHGVKRPTAAAAVVANENDQSNNSANQQDESVWIFGLINNIEQLLSNFTAINSTSSSTSKLTSSGASTPSAPPSSLASSTAPSPPSSFSSSLDSTNSPNNNATCNTSTFTNSSSSSSSSSSSISSSSSVASTTSSTAPSAQQVAAIAGGSLPRSPVSRQIKFHEYKGPPSVKRQQQSAKQQHNATSGGGSHTSRASLQTNNETSGNKIAPAGSAAPQQVAGHNSQLVGSAPNCEPLRVIQQQQRDQAIVLGQKKLVSGQISPFAATIQQANALRNVSFQQNQMSANHPHSLVAVKSQAHIAQQQHAPRRHPIHPMRQQPTQVTSGPPAGLQTFYIKQESNRPLESPPNGSAIFIERQSSKQLDLNDHHQQQQQRYQFEPPQMQHHLQFPNGNRELSQLPSQRVCNSSVMVRTIQQPSNGIPVGGVLMSQASGYQEQQHCRQQAAAHMIQVQPQQRPSALASRHQQLPEMQQQQQVQYTLYANANHYVPATVCSVAAASTNQLISYTNTNEQFGASSDGYSPLTSQHIDEDELTASFGPDSEETDACEIEPSIGFATGIDELLFSEFIDLQDVPMNVDESDWLKKFLPPCSMG